MWRKHLKLNSVEIGNVIVAWNQFIMPYEASFIEKSEKSSLVTFEPIPWPISSNFLHQFAQGWFLILAFLSSCLIFHIWLWKEGKALFSSKLADKQKFSLWFFFFLYFLHLFHLLLWPKICCDCQLRAKQMKWNVNLKGERRLKEWRWCKDWFISFNCGGCFNHPSRLIQIKCVRFHTSDKVNIKLQSVDRVFYGNVSMTN